MGAFSSNNRMDFKAVLESFTNTEIPMHNSELEWSEGNDVDIAQRRRRIFFVSDFGGGRATEILFKAHDLQSIFTSSGESRLSSTIASRISTQKARGKIPIVRPFQERRMRSTAKEKNKKGFHRSFGRTGASFPTLLAGSVNYFTFWYEGEEEKGFIHQLTPLECESLMGLPEGWTALGTEDEAISNYARYKAIGNAIAVPCAEYNMAGIAEVL